MDCTNANIYKLTKTFVFSRYSSSAAHLFGYGLLSYTLITYYIPGKPKLIALHLSPALAPARIRHFSKSGKNPAAGKIPPEPDSIARC